MSEETTKKKQKTYTVSSKLSSVDYERALYVMRSFGIRTLSALIRELINEMYFYLQAEEIQKEQEQAQGGKDGDSL